ncbi:MAG TPA: DUF2252 family protein [Myxococcota bacterium]|nr:DUF2252 family protein [Myxococcota bacterium]HND29405.1 DUF2252 family protein [Myxococcota bacterium]
MWWLLACAASVDEVRMAQLRDVLVADNQIWLVRDPEQVEEKYDRMAEDPYDFLRGTAALYYQDLQRPNPERASTEFQTDPRSFGLLVIGDPHPENFGTLLPGNDTRTGPSIEVVDLDAGGYGSWLYDLRRSILGMQVFTWKMKGCGDDCREALARVQAEAYVAELREPGFVPSDPAWGGIVLRLLQESWTEGRLNLRMEEEVEAGHLVREGIDHGEGTRALTPEEEAQLQALTAGRNYRVLDAVRRYGTGVASFAAIRYTVLADTGSSGPEDDVLLNLREVVDPPLLPRVGTQLFDSPSDRLVQLSQHLWTRPDADSWLDGMDYGSISFKQGSISGWTHNFDHDDMAELWEQHLIGQEDLEGLAAFLGTALAGCHLRGGSLDGSPPLDILEGEIGGREALFVEERLRDARLDALQLESDYALFQLALDRYGSLLGAEAAADFPR